MDTSELRKWAEKHSIESKTIKFFWVNFNSYRKEDEEEFIEVFGKDFNEKKLNINVDKIGLFIDAWNKDASFQYGYDYVVSYIPIYYEDEQVGEFRMQFNLDGEHENEFFVTY